MLKDREAQKQSLKARLQSLDRQGSNGPLRVDQASIESELTKLDEVLNEDREAANAFLRQHVKIRCTPTQRGGRRFYRGVGEANGGGIIKSLGLAQAFDFGSCGGWI